MQYSLFFVATNHTRSELFDCLRASMDTNDALQVIDFSGITLNHVPTEIVRQLQCIINTGAPRLPAANPRVG